MLFLINGWSRLNAHLHNEGQAVGDTALNATAIIGSCILKGGQGDCVNDHRLVMAGTLMALISEKPVKLKDSEAITKSYPDFFEDWNLLGGNAQPV